MHIEQIRHHADHRLATLRRPRLTAASDSLWNRIRYAVARSLRSHAVRLESPQTASTPSL